MEPWQLTILFFAAAYSGLLLFAWLLSDRLIFPVPPAGYMLDSKGVFTIRGPHDSPMCAVHLKNEDAKYTLLYSHGNAEDIGSILPLLKLYTQHGFNVFAYDYPGYGYTPGKSSEEHTYLAIDCAYSHLINQAKVPPEKIILYGRSLGGGPSVDIATREKPAGLILEATFMTTFRILTRIKIIPWDKFDNLSKIENINCPLLSIHGTRDEVVPFGHGKYLHQYAPKPKYNEWIDGADHNNIIETMGNRYWECLNEFANGLDTIIK